MNSIFKYLPHFIIILLLGFFIFGILKGCQNLQSSTNEPSTTIDSSDQASDEEEASLDDLFEDDGSTDDGANTDDAVTDAPASDSEEETDPTPAPSEDTEPTEVDDSSKPRHYLVVAGSFSNERNAKNEMARLKKLGYDNTEVKEFDFSQYFSVIVGRYRGLGEARAVARKLIKDHNAEAYVHKMRGKRVKN